MNCKKTQGKGKIIINRTRCTGKKQEKKERGKRSHFSKAIQKDNQGSRITGPTSLTSRFTGGPAVTVPSAGRFCILLGDRA